jgi:hypothetical protein
MPLTWSIDHEARLVVLNATGLLNRADVVAYMQKAAQQGAAGYRALFDATAAQFELGSDDIVNLVQMASARGGGAIAFVVESEAEREMADQFARRASGGRSCRLFADAAQARAWLAGQAKAATS